MPRVGHPWRKHYYDAWFIVMIMDTSMMIILVMSWNTATTAQVWLPWFCHKIIMDAHAWQKTWPTVTNTYHHGSVFFCSASLFFSRFFIWDFSFFYGLSLFLFLTWDNALENDDHHTSIYLKLNDYNSILEQGMTLYECLRRYTGICNESRVTCMK